MPDRPTDYPELDIMNIECIINNKRFSAKQKMERITGITKYWFTDFLKELILNLDEQIW